MTNLTLPRAEILRISRLLWPEWAAHDRDGPVRVVRRILAGAPVGGMATQSEVLKIRELARVALSRVPPCRRIRDLRFGDVLDLLDGERQP